MLVGLVPLSMTKAVITAAFLLLSTFCSCGGTNTQIFDPTVITAAPPFVSRIDPASGVAGDTATIYGFGFSSEAASNFVSFGDEIVSPSAYTFIEPATVADELETLTITIPAGLASGDHIIAISVFNNASNADVIFTVK